ncbi:MAG: alpha/beta hydrolase-fold protein [Bryobacteraceae bacterium]
MRLFQLLFAVFAGLPLLAQQPSFVELLRMGKAAAPELKTVLPAAMGEANLKKGAAYAAEGSDFLFAVETPSAPQLLVDDAAGSPMKRVKGTDLWVGTSSLETGAVHSFSYLIDGKPFGGKTDVLAFGPYSYAKPGVPAGKLSEKLVHTSRIYPGMKSDYWVYVPAQYDPKTPAAVMVWQDGEVLVPRELPSRAQVVFDNLTYEKKIPVIIQVLISPGLVGETKMRSIEYDSVNDTYARFLRDEILAEVQLKYNLRKEGYSRAIAGDSSGGICAFNVAWQQPDQFSRVLSRIGSFTSIQWKPGILDGGNVFPNKIRKEPHRNVRVWLQDGSGDLENEHGSWPLQNVQMANSLKLREYDFHLAWGAGTHNRNGGHAELADEMIWLWRDYDAGKTEQTYQMEASERAKPLFRIKALNRD